MNKLLFTLALSICGLASLHGQSIFDLNCESLERNDTSVLIVTGLMDHNELEISWFKEEIKPDSIEVWANKYLRKSLSNNPDSLELKSINQSLKYIATKWKRMQLHLKPGDRIFYYSTPEIYWNSLAGQDGLVILRKCLVIGMLILAQS
jgi:hypothetical protein